MKEYKNIIFDLFDTLILFNPELLPVIELDNKIYHSTGMDVFNTFSYYFPKIYFNEFYNFFTLSYRKFQELKNIDNREYVNSKRFEIMLDQMNLNYNNKILDDLVVSHMSSLEKSMIFPEKHRIVLDYLKEKSYNLSILSNFDYSPTANKLLDIYNITHYFDYIFISDQIGWRKPSPKIFEYAIEKIGENKSDILFIGNDFERDIIGAQNSGIDSIYINLNNKYSDINAFVESVNSLNEIITFI